VLGVHPTSETVVEHVVNEHSCNYKGQQHPTNEDEQTVSEPVSLRSNSRLHPSRCVHLNYVVEDS
jgi:hypothetical protein